MSKPIVSGYAKMAVLRVEHSNLEHVRCPLIIY